MVLVCLLLPQGDLVDLEDSLVGGCASVLVSGEFMSALSLGRSPWEATHCRLSEALPQCEAVPRQIRVTAQLWHSFWA